MSSVGLGSRYDEPSGAVRRNLTGHIAIQRRSLRRDKGEATGDLAIGNRQSVVTMAAILAIRAIHRLNRPAPLAIPVASPQACRAGSYSKKKREPYQRNLANKHLPSVGLHPLFDWYLREIYQSSFGLDINNVKGNVCWPAIRRGLNSKSGQF